MRARRILIALVLALGLGALVAFGSEASRPGASTYANLPPPGMPVAPTAAGITSSWFCAGVPTTGERGGDVVVTNPGTAPLRGRLTVYSTTGSLAQQDIQIAPREATTFALEKISTGDYLSAFVEIDGGLGLVEQRARHPNGVSLAPCSNTPSNNWYFADGITQAAGYDLVITNPFPGYTNVTVQVLTVDGVRTPSELRNQTIAGTSVLKIDLEQYGLRDEQLLSVWVQSTPERVVASRAQNYYGGLGRRGYALTQGAPSADYRWYFPDGEKATGVSESLTLYNPGEEPAIVAVQVFTAAQGGPDYVAVQGVTVAEGSVQKVDIDAIAGLPAGRHSIIVESPDAPIVVEQVITRGSGGGAVTSIAAGSRVAGTRWWVPTPLADAGEESLLVTNATGIEGTFTVYALGPGGLVAVPGLIDVPLRSANDFVGGLAAVDLTGRDVIGKALLIESTVDTVVLRRPGRGANLKGRSSVLALPEG